MSVSLDKSASSVSGSLQITVNATDASGIATITASTGSGSLGSKLLHRRYSFSTPPRCPMDPSPLTVAAVDTVGNSATTNIALTVSNQGTVTRTVHYYRATYVGRHFLPHQNRQWLLDDFSRTEDGHFQIQLVTPGQAAVLRELSTPVSSLQGGAGMIKAERALPLYPMPPGSKTGRCTTAIRISRWTIRPCSGSITVPAAPLSGTITISAEASDDKGVVKVAFYAGSTLIAEDTAAPYSVSLDTKTIANGTHAFKACGYRYRRPDSGEVRGTNCQQYFGCHPYHSL